MRDEAVELTLAIEGGEDGDVRELDELTTQLRRLLLDLDVHAVEPVRGTAVPEGARSVDPATIGALLVTLASPVLQQVVAFLDSWRKNRRVRNVTLTIGDDTIVLSDATAEEKQQLVDLFVARHVTG